VREAAQAIGPRAGAREWTGNPVKNVCTTPVVAGQWQKKRDRLDIATFNGGESPEIKTI
jgi:hypothetical protein